MQPTLLRLFKVEENRTALEALQINGFAQDFEAMMFV
jgi:hypothetical protein